MHRQQLHSFPRPAQLQPSYRISSRAMPMLVIAVQLQPLSYSSTPSIGYVSLFSFSRPNFADCVVFFVSQAAGRDVAPRQRVSRSLACSSSKGESDKVAECGNGSRSPLLRGRWIDSACRAEAGPLSRKLDPARPVTGVIALGNGHATVMR
jgi:hypothetical protein